MQRESYTCKRIVVQKALCRSETGTMGATEEDFECNGNDVSENCVKPRVD